MDEREEHILNLKREIAAATLLKEQLQDQIVRLDGLLEKVGNEKGKEKTGKRAGPGKPGTNRPLPPET